MSAPTVVRLQRRVQVLERKLAKAKRRNQDLRDLLDSARFNVEREQDEHAAYRTAHPPRRRAA